jgi:hypothetical protein
MSHKNRNNTHLNRFLMENELPISTEMWENPAAPRPARGATRRIKGPRGDRGWLRGLLSAGIWRSYQTARAALHLDL